MTESKINKDDDSWSEKLRKPFNSSQISKLPKPTKQQTEEVKRDYTKGIRCTLCGSWHHRNVTHVDYVGHAAVTDRLLSVDPLWNWEFISTNDDGFPLLDPDNGLWIKLTINGMTRKGYGDAGAKRGPDAMKERIGDAIRNAAMRFGVALELWHKGDLHDEEGPNDEQGGAGGDGDHYPKSAFDLNFPDWKSLIAEGKRSKSKIIDFVNHNGELKLSKEQMIKINGVKVKNGQ